MSGTMTDGEVITSFRQAKNKREQIGILSELNACSKSDILNILCAAGEDVSNYISGMPKKKPAEKKDGAPAEARTAARRWSEDEETILREGCFAGGSCGDIARALGRTEKSVYFKAREMGLTFSADKAAPAAAPEAETSAPPDGVPAVPKSKSIHKWTDEDDGILCALRAEGKTEREIALAIGCSRQAVGWHISKLKKAGMLCEAKSGIKVCVGGAMAEADCGEAAEEQADCGEAASAAAPDAEAMADGGGGDAAGAGQVGKLGDILDMICRLVSAMACEPGKVHIDMPEDDAALLEMDFGSCAVRVML